MHQLSVTFNRDAGRRKPLNEQTLVQILRKDKRTIGREVPRNAVKRDMGRAGPPHPQIDARNPVSAFQYGISQVKLSIQLERPRLNSECA